MPLPTLKPGGYPINDPRNITISIYGTNASNAVVYAVAPVSTGTVIALSKYTDLISKVNLERVRRGATNATITISGTILASHFNALKTALEIAGPAEDKAYNTNQSTATTTYPQVPAPSGSTAQLTGAVIYAAAVNALITELNNAGAVCTCNCNYCTCNCNYCTCNCNYACTCNCNYS